MSRQILAVGLAMALGVAGACSGDDDESGSNTTTTIATGGLEIPTPDGWQEIPMPIIGFGLAVPNGWEATRLDEQALASLAKARPLVPGFLQSAQNAYSTGSVFYAAGVDDSSHITDLKIRADVGAGVTDAAGLETYARDQAAKDGLPSPSITVVPDADRPTVDVRYQMVQQRPADSNDGTMVDVTTEGTQRFVLGPKKAIYMLILTSETVAGHDDLADQLFATLVFV